MYASATTTFFSKKNRVYRATELHEEKEMPGCEKEVLVRISLSNYI
tara:strand:+ start:191 stop:328 length:138 start_codon:yes stop_codon:yes gene_type:complete